LLDELRERLRRPAACQPNCALITHLGLRAQSQSLQLRLEVHAGAATFVPLPGGSWRPADVRLDGHAANLRRDNLGDGMLWLQMPVGIHQVTMSSPLAADTVQIALPLPPKVVTTDIAGWTLSGVDARGLATGALTLTRTQTAGGARGNLSGRQSEGDRQEDSLPPFVRVIRTIQLDRQWTIATQILRAGASQAPITVRVLLLAGEAVTDAGVRVENGTAIVTVAAGAGGGFSSVLAVRPTVELRAADEINQIETWRLDVAPMWHAEFSGLAPVTRQEGSRWLPQWQPWPGEKVMIAAVQPEGVAGQTLTIDDVQLSAKAGQRSTDVTAILTLRSSQGGNQIIELPEQAELRAVRIDGAPQPIRAEGRRVTLPLVPGARNVALDWRETRGISSIYPAAQADFGAPAVNVRTTIAVPADRWILAVGGPLLGPAVLFWGIAIVIAAGAVVLARLRWTPFGALAWFLLGLGVAQATLAGLVVVVAVTLAFQARHRFGARVPGWRFNLMQIVLAVTALIALSILFEAIRTGLLGRPDMLITGNGSSAYQLNWYTDRIDRTPPTAWVVSAPLWAYRVLMLAWALWLALAVIRWARWAWIGFASERLWEKVSKRSAPSPIRPAPTASTGALPPDPPPTPSTS